MGPVNDMDLADDIDPAMDISVSPQAAEEFDIDMYYDRFEAVQYEQQFDEKIDQEIDQKIDEEIKEQQAEEFASLEPQSGNAAQDVEEYNYEEAIDIDTYYEQYARKRSDYEQYARKRSEPESVGFVSYQEGEPPSAALDSGAYRRDVSPAWNAVEGSRVKDVLEGWSKRAGVQFIWDTENEFAVLEKIEEQTSYEDAVAVLLWQYADNGVRPVGSLHVDSQNEQRILVVQVVD